MNLISKEERNQIMRSIIRLIQHLPSGQAEGVLRETLINVRCLSTTPLQDNQMFTEILEAMTGETDAEQTGTAPNAGKKNVTISIDTLLPNNRVLSFPITEQTIKDMVNEVIASAVIDFK